MLGLDLDSWNDVLVVSLSLAALAAVVVGVATFAVIRLQRAEEIATKAEFEQYKVEANERISSTEARAAEANQKAEEERLARVKIEERLAPRSITDGEFARLVTDLSKTPNSTIAVWQAGETPEIGMVSRIVLAALQEAHWDATAWVWSGIGPVVGLVLIVKPDADDKTVAAANGLAAALGAVRLPCARVDWPGAWAVAGGMHNGPMTPLPTAPPIRLIIGTKP